MNIGIDLDGVLFETEKFLRYYAEIIDLDNNGKGLINPSAWSAKERHGWTEKQWKDFQKVRICAGWTSPLAAGARYVVGRLVDEGHNIYLITARGQEIPEEIELTKQRLREETIPYKKLVFSKKDKVAVCKENKIDIMIEDCPNNIKKLAKNNIKCLYLREAEFEQIKNKNVVQVYNWGQIYRIINEQARK